jgi:hypothetical protein
MERNPFDWQPSIQESKAEEGRREVRSRRLLKYKRCQGRNKSQAITGGMQ